MVTVRGTKRRVNGRPRLCTCIRVRTRVYMYNSVLSAQLRIDNTTTSRQYGFRPCFSLPTNPKMKTYVGTTGERPSYASKVSTDHLDPGVDGRRGKRHACATDPDSFPRGYTRGPAKRSIVPEFIFRNAKINRVNRLSISFICVQIPSFIPVSKCLSFARVLG